MLRSAYLSSLVLLIATIAQSALAELPMYDPFAPAGQPTLWSASTGTTLTIIATSGAPVAAPPMSDGAIGCITTTGTDSGGIDALSPTSLNHYVLEMDLYVKPADAATTEGIGLVFHLNPPLPVGGSFYIQTSPAQSADFSIVSGANGHQQSWELPPASSQYITPNAWHKISVELDAGYSATIRVDNTLWATLVWQNDIGSPAGKFGISQYANGSIPASGVVNYIDNFRAYVPTAAAADWYLY